MPSGKPHLLYLCHRIPYPPNKGDKIRSYRLLLALASRYRVHLGAFVDDPGDWRYQAEVEGLCHSSRLFGLHPLAGRLRGLTGLLTRQPLTLAVYQDSRMRHWVRETWERHDIGHIVVFSSAMAQYVTDDDFRRARRVIDFVDVDSDKWRQYAGSKPFYSAWLYRLEAQRLEFHDKGLARAFDLSLFVSPQEAALFRNLLGTVDARVESMVNGVDTDYFSPDPARVNPFPTGQRALVFTGAMDYWANVDAVSWFCREVMPLIRKQFNDLVFYIVGIRPGEAVRRLEKTDIVVTGEVKDVRPYLQHAAAVVAPMRIARGIQNKVLEGMSMARPVVVTGKGLEGIDARDGDQVLVAESSGDYVRILGDILAGAGDALGQRAREQVCGANSWDTSLQRFLGFVEG